MATEVRTMIKTIFRSFLVVCLTTTVVSSTFGQQSPFDNSPGGQPGDPATQVPDETISVEPGAAPTVQLPAVILESPEVMVREEFAGWQAAGTDLEKERLSQVLRANWVMADPNGKITGQVGTIGSADLEYFHVYLLNSGRLQTSTNVNLDGSFVFNNIVAGAYSLVGVGDNGFFAFGFNAIDFVEGADPGIPRSLQVTAFQNHSTINIDWIRYFSPKIKFRVFGQYTSGEGADDPAQLFGFEGLQANSPAASPATSIFNHQVKRTADGVLRGRVHQFNSLHGRPVDVRETKVMLLFEDQVVGSTTTDNFGVFEIKNVPAGEYAIVAAGVDGLGCIGVTVVDGIDATPSDVIDFTMASSETVGWLNDHAIDSAYKRAILQPKPKDEKKCEFCGGQCGPGGCGGQYGNLGGGRQRGFLRNFTRGFNGFFDRLFYPDDYDPNKVFKTSPYGRADAFPAGSGTGELYGSGFYGGYQYPWQTPVNKIGIGNGNSSGYGYGGNGVDGVDGVDGSNGSNGYDYGSDYSFGNGSESGFGYGNGTGNGTGYGYGYGNSFRGGHGSGFRPRRNFGSY